MFKTQNQGMKGKKGHLTYTPIFNAINKKFILKLTFFVSQKRFFNMEKG